MESKKINQLATNVAPLSTDLTIIGDPSTGVSKKVTLSQIASIFAGAVDFYANLAAFPASGTLNTIYCAKDTQKLYLWSGSAYVETFPSQAVLNTYQLLSAKGVANGYASLDASGKVPIGELPSSIMEYKGLWSAATNTPTLANGTGDTGDVYICSAAGSVNFGAGAITFAVGDYVIYSGTIWQRSSGAVGTVTSVGLSSATSGVTIGSSPVTTSGTITLAIATATTSQNGLLSSTDWATFNGKESVLTFSSPLVRTTNTISIPAATTSVNGYLASADFTTFNNKQNAITLTTTGSSGVSTLVGATLNIPDYGSALTGYVTLATTQTITGAKTFSGYTTFTSTVDITSGLTFSNSGFTLVLQPPTLSVNRTVTLPNATGTLALTSDISYPVSSVFGRTGAVVATNGDYTTAQVTESGNLYFTDSRARLALSGSTGISYNNTTGVITNSAPDQVVALTASTGISVTGTYPNFTITNTSPSSGGTVTSVAALTIGTSGTDLSSSVANSTTTPVITLNVPTASAANRGALSSADWTTFNNKQSTITLTTTGTSGAATFSANTLNIPNYTITNAVTGTGTTNYLPKFTGASTIGDSIVSESGAALSVAGTLTAGLITADNADIYSQNGTGSNLSIGFKQSSAVKFRLRYDIATDIVAMVGSSGNFIQYWNQSGNVGLGVTPSAWNSIYKVAEIGTAAIFGSSSYNSAAFSTNVFYNSGNSPRYIANDFSNMYWQDDGNHIWYNAPSGTAGNAITFTQAMTLTAAGFLGIGTPTPNVILEVGGLVVDVTKTVFRSSLAVAPTAYFNDITAIYSGASAAANKLQINYANGYTSGTGIVLQGDGKVGIGTTSPSGKLHIAATTGVATPGSIALAIRDSGNSGYGFDFNLEGVATGDLSLMRTELDVQAQIMTFKRSNGNVLIGTTTDSGYKLDVNGTGRFSDRLNVYKAVGENIIIANYDTNNRLEIGGAGLNLVGGNNFYIRQASGANQFTLNASTGAATFSSGIATLGYTASTSYAALFNGSVGIGTSSPRSLLDITNGTANSAGSSAPNLGIFTGAAATFPLTATLGNVAILSNTAQAADVGMALVLGGRYTNSSTVATAFGAISAHKENSTSNNLDGYLCLHTNQSGSVTEKMRITSGGNIGIGTATPSTLVQAYSTAVATQISIDGTGRYKYFETYASGTRKFRVGWDNTSVQAEVWADANAPIVFATNDIEKMRITSGGNVGIGRTDPPYPLSVASPYAKTDTTGRSLAFFSSNEAIASNPFGLFVTITGAAALANRVIQLGTADYGVANGGNLALQASGGNVLIGTTTDNSNKFQVSGTGNQIASFTGTTYANVRIVTTSSAQGSQIEFVSSSNSGNTWSLGKRDDNLNSTATGSFWLYNSATASTAFWMHPSTNAANFTGSVTATSFFESSDSRLKTLIQDNYQTKGIASITPKLYTKNGKVELGYYAQDFVGILDSAVSKGSDDMLSLSYREVLVAKVYALEQRIKELENK